MAKRKKQYKPKNPKSTTPPVKKQETAPTPKKLKLEVFIPFLIGFAQWVLTYFFLPDNNDLFRSGLSLGNFKFLNVFYAIVTALFIKFYNIKQVRIGFSVSWLLFVLTLIGNSLLLKLLDIEVFQEKFLGLYHFSTTFFIVPMVWGAWLAWTNREKLNAEETSRPVNKWLVIGTSVAIALVAFFFLSHELDKLDFFEDEFQVVEAAKGFQESGQFKRWDFAKDELSKYNYKRAWPHTSLIALSYEMFGLSEWSSRIVSVLMGMLSCCLVFLLTLKLSRNYLLGLLAAFTFMLHPDMIHLFRYTRMYAMWIPFLFATFWLLALGLTSENTTDWKNPKLNAWINKNANFNYWYLLSGTFLFWFSYTLHPNSVILALSIVVFSVLVAIDRKQWILLSLPILFVAIVAAVMIFTPNAPSVMFLSFFDMNIKEYSEWIMGFPLLSGTTAIFLVGILPAVFRGKKTINYFAVILAFVTLIVFRYILTYYGYGIRFVSGVVGIVMVFVFIFSHKLTQAIFNRKVAYLLPVLLFTIALSSSFKNQDDLMEGRTYRPNYREAYGVIKKNIEPDEVLFGQYMRKVYMSEVLQKNKFLSLGTAKKYAPQKFLQDITANPKGWLVWTSRKSNHINDTILQYVRQNFKQYCGLKLDSTFIEVFRYDKSMIPGTPEFADRNRNVFNTNAYLNFSKPLCLSYWVSNLRTGSGVPLLLENGKDLLNMNFINDSTLQLTAEQKMKQLALPRSAWKHITLNFTPENTGGKWTCFINGQQVAESAVSSVPKDWLRLHINLLFGGNMQDIRVFNETLPLGKIIAIYNNGQPILDEKVPLKDGSFAPQHHFVKR